MEDQMINFSHLKQFAKVTVIAASLIAGYTAPVFAHGYKACCADVRAFCGSDNDCINSGCNACISHTHPGNPVPEPPDPEFSADPGRHRPPRLPHTVYGKSGAVLPDGRYSKSD